GCRRGPRSTPCDRRRCRVCRPRTRSFDDQPAGAGRARPHRGGGAFGFLIAHDRSFVIEIHVVVRIAVVDSKAERGTARFSLNFGSQLSQRGRYQFQSPSSFIALGRTTERMIVASIRSAAATPKPICWNMISSPLAKPAKTATMINAAPVMMRAVEATPKVTAPTVSPVAS